MENSQKPANEEKVWYALRVTYNRELKVKDDLDSRGVESFIPMQYKLMERAGRMVKRLVPTVHNLIFVHTTPSFMRAYKERTHLPIRYIMNRERHQPVVVPEWQMRNFIAVAGTYDEQLVYLTPEPGDFATGDRVKVLGGIFEGAEGVLVRVKGDRRVLVSIEGVVAVATTFIHPSMLQKLPNNDKNKNTTDGKD